ncbi:hypothetical protein [Micromonospora sp. URMC 103]|uniref:hypothetical protein n=1 Tax=Micromonospora sp. URMC 103 TaxID=3423406 RepID=UPI003F1D0C8B
MTEQRYRAVLEVDAGLSVTEVAERFGVRIRPCTDGWAGIATTGWPAWPIDRTDRVRIPPETAPAPRQRRLMPC